MKIFKRIIFWFLLILTTIFIITIMNDKNANTETTIIMIIVFLIPWGIYLIVKLIKKESPKAKVRAEKYQKMVEEKRKESEEKYKGYKLIAEYQNHTLYVNEEKKQFALGENFYKFKDLISAEVITKDDIVTTTHTKKKASVGKALVGGLLFGGAGAIIGGTSGKAKSTSTNIKVCDKLQIKLTLNSLENPVFHMDFIKVKTSEYFKTYQKAFDKAEHFLGVFQFIINNK